MDLKEALEILKIAKAEVEWEYPLNYQVAFDVAIKAVEQDYKDRLSEVLDNIIDYLNYLKVDSSSYFGISSDKKEKYDAINDRLDDAIAVVMSYKP